MRLCELREKEVINICTCRCIGCVMDVDINNYRGEKARPIVLAIFGIDYPRALQDVGAFWAGI